MTRPIECESCVVNTTVHCFLWTQYEQNHSESDLEELRGCPCITCIVKMMCLTWCKERTNYLKKVTSRKKSILCWNVVN